MKIARCSAVVLGLLLAVADLPASAQPACALSPVIGLFREVLGADVVGDCQEPAVIAANGDVTQATTKGLAVYRYADQVTEFTDGQTTWLFGPEGLQERASGDRFAWEVRTEQAAGRAVPIEPAVGSTGTAPPPAPPESKMTPALAAKCSNLAYDVIATGPPAGNVSGETIARATADLMTMCRQIVTQYGEPGYLCFEPAARAWPRSIVAAGPGNSRLATDAFSERVNACLRSLPR